MKNKKTVFQSLLALILLFSHGLTYAALPATLNYQGHLTDAAGAPVNGPVNMTFQIYDVSAGGIGLWTGNSAVTVDQGVFSVELGDGASPFPPGLFETRLWIGLSIETDAEMSPRRPISSVGFSFKASDADTLEGISAASLDQSAHVTDTANPHAVTAAQVGAADAATLSAHTTDTANPHAVTAAQVGAATSADILNDISAHSADVNAHHAKTSVFAELAGQVSDAQVPASIARDAEIMPAVLTADGAGSTLDADLVDGMQASELIAAAMDEVRMSISSLPFTISQSGSYYLTGNLDGSSGGININVDNVTIDMMGFTIDGGGVDDKGINISINSNVTIRNGTIRDFGKEAIYKQAGQHAKIIDVHVFGNGSIGTVSSIFLLGEYNFVERCTAGDGFGHGIFTQEFTTILNSVAFNNQGIGIKGLHGSIISGNKSYGNTGNGIEGGDVANISGNTSYANQGYGIKGGIGVIIDGNTAYGNAGSYGIYGLGGSNINGNTAYSNAGKGIYGATSSTISRNTAYANGGSYGIGGGNSCSIIGNTVHGNSGSYGLYAGSGSSLIENTVYNNTNWGIYVTQSSLVKDNTIYGNNVANVSTQGGLRIGNDNRVTGNTLDQNYQNNIYVGSGDNAFIDNHLTDSTNGINFVASGNYYRNNTAAGNANSFTGFVPATSGDGGGNASF